MAYLVFVRHGESVWNKENKFTGWVDVPLSVNGIKEAESCAKKLDGIDFEIAFTSVLERAQETLLIILSRQKKTGIFLHEDGKEMAWQNMISSEKKKIISVYCSEKLNERYYGKLQGMDKTEARKKFGKKKVFQWRRGYKDKPPGGESLFDVYKRAWPYFNKKVLSQVKKGNDVIMCAHGNSLRAILKKIEGISDKKISFLDLPFAEPIIYEYSKGKLVRITRNHEFTRPILWK